MTDTIPGFFEPEDNTDDQPTKKQTKEKKSGFGSFGLSQTVLKGIVKRGYKIPTPIQRKTIPLILEGRDVVAMAKTGSGKTACFLIPLFEKLKKREIKGGARALILSPTRELAIQTYKFVKDLGKFLDLKTILVLGGDSMDSQFTAIHAFPDVIVATPGRFLHVCVEMDLKLHSVEYVVFDEADRLFEMGFGEQLNETLKRLPEGRQTVLFSATLPKMMADFARAGLSDPVLLRLDVETKVPETLDLKFIFCRPDERYATLLALLSYVIPKNAQTVVFAGTQHHVELISFVLKKAGISNTLVYSSLDAAARKENTSMFVHKKVSVLVVTDVAARGIDIPNLDYVINLHFPGKPKLFIHRVGRCARAGRSGTAFSIFSTDDEAHLMDLMQFLGRPLDINDSATIGTVPTEFTENEHQQVREWVTDTNIEKIYRTSCNAYKQYINTRPAASAEANRRVKRIKFYAMKALDSFLAVAKEKNVDMKVDFLAKMKNFRPSTTIFELNPKSNSQQYKVMTDKRRIHDEKIINFKRKCDEEEGEDAPKPKKKKAKKQKIELETAGDFKDENYIPYQSKDKATDDGLAINSFARDANNAEFSVAGDTPATQNFVRQLQRWDRKKKKMVNVEDPRAGKIRTEHGVWIPASYKTDRYAKWKSKSKTDEQVDNTNESDEEVQHTVRKSHPHTHWGRHNAKLDLKKLRDFELKTPDQIVKTRIHKETIKEREESARKRNTDRRKKTMSKRMRK